MTRNARESLRRRAIQYGKLESATVPTRLLRLAARDLPLADLRAGRQTLEDVSLRLTTGDREALRESAP